MTPAERTARARKDSDEVDKIILERDLTAFYQHVFCRCQAQSNLEPEREFSGTK
jgi:hypothetical protein